ncbi:MAG: hypothetical protein ACRD9R_13990 [Pyrinomonadaceae bacterium]
MNLARHTALFSALSRRALLLCAAALLLASLGVAALAQETYRKPSKEVLDILNAPVTPVASVSPARDVLILATGVRYPPIADLAQPMLRLAGLRINPNTNGPHRAGYFVALTLKRIADGAETKIELPPGAQAGAPLWSYDGKHFAFTNTTPAGVELWAGDSQTGRVQKLKGVAVNAVYGAPVQWMPGGRALLVRTIVANRKPLSPAPNVPREPVIQESAGRAGPVRTYQDLLKNQYDEEQFTYYATAQLALVDAMSGKVTPVGQPAVFETVDAAPDGQHLLVSRIQRPYSYLYPASDFPKEVEVWDAKGKLVHKLASLPLQDQVPIDGVQTGPRGHTWRPTEPATLVWAEALDNGDPKKKVPHRDRVLMLKAPFTSSPVELTKTEHRYTGVRWGEKDGAYMVSDYDRNRRWTTTRMLSADNPADAGKMIFSRSVQDRYNDPGTPITKVLPTGGRVVIQDGDNIYLTGAGASPAGDQPFLDRFNVRTAQAERLFHSQPNAYEYVVTILEEYGRSFLTSRETPAAPPNYFLRTRVPAPIGHDAAGRPIQSDVKYLETAKPLTNFPDPTPQLRAIKKQLVRYKL